MVHEQLLEAGSLVVPRRLRLPAIFGVLLLLLLYWAFRLLRCDDDGSHNTLLESGSISGKLRSDFQHFDNPDVLERTPNCSSQKEVDFVTLHSPPSPDFDESQLCPEESPFILGLRNVSRGPVTMEEVERELAGTPGLVPGGSYRPTDCQSRHKVAIVIPYRDRMEQLTVLLRHLHPFLQRQQLAYTIFVVEQTPNVKLNRGMLKNIGFMEAMRREMYECVIFNDVDLLPEDDRNLYGCPDTPRHLSVVIDIYNYELLSSDNFGGVVGLTTPQFTQVNGYSNLYWGWGCEDDDLYDRVLFHDYNITRPEPTEWYRYVMLPHKKDPPSPERKKFLRRPIRYSKYDGLTNLNYRRISLDLFPLFTHVFVDLKPP